VARYTAPRGTRDILPEDQPYWRYVEERLHAIAHLYGYERITPPIFEDTAIFERGVGEGTDIVEKEMYTFLDRGGKSLTPSARPSATSAPRLAATASITSSTWRPSARRTRPWTWR